jgi:peroxiredoxin
MYQMPKLATREMPIFINFEQMTPDFKVQDHASKTQTLTNMMGENGVILGFIGEIWNPVNIQRIIWLQKHAHSIHRSGYKLALVTRDQPQMLYGYYVSCLTPPPFPLLTDVAGDVHSLFDMAGRSGMVVLDRMRVARHKWEMPADRIWPRLTDITGILEAA